MRKAFRIIIIALLITAGSIGSAQAQRRAIRYLANYENEPYHFGFLIGTTNNTFTVKTVENYQNIALGANQWEHIGYNPDATENLYVYNVETKADLLSAQGFVVGIIGSKRLGKYFDLRLIPSLNFGNRKLVYTIAAKPKDGGNYVIRKDSCDLKHTVFVDFPLQIKYRSKRLNNIGAYLLGGVNPKLDLTKSGKSKDGEDEPNALLPKRFDCALEIGAGFDIYNQWFKMGIELKMSYGLLDVVKNEALIYTAPIESLRNKMFQVSVTFE